MGNKSKTPPPNTCKVQTNATGLSRAHGKISQHVIKPTPQEDESTPLAFFLCIILPVPSNSSAVTRVGEGARPPPPSPPERPLLEVLFSSLPVEGNVAAFPLREVLELLVEFALESAGALAARAGPDTPGSPRRGGGCDCRPRALFSNAAARADALGALEAAMTAWAAPLAGGVAAARGAAGDTPTPPTDPAADRWYRAKGVDETACFTATGAGGASATAGAAVAVVVDVSLFGDVDGLLLLTAAAAAAVAPAGDPTGASFAATGRLPPARGSTPPARGEELFSGTEPTLLLAAAVSIAAGALAAEVTEGAAAAAAEPVTVAPEDAARAAALSATRLLTVEDGLAVEAAEAEVVAGAGAAVLGDPLDAPNAAARAAIPPLEATGAAAGAGAGAVTTAGLLIAAARIATRLTGAGAGAGPDTGSGSATGAR